MNRLKVLNKLHEIYDNQILGHTELAHQQMMFLMDTLNDDIADVHNKEEQCPCCGSYVTAITNSDIIKALDKNSEAAVCECGEKQYISKLGIKAQYCKCGKSFYSQTDC